MCDNVLKNPCYVLWHNILCYKNPTSFSQKVKIWWLTQMCFNLIYVLLLSLYLLDIPSSWKRTRWIAPFWATILELCWGIWMACCNQLVCVGWGHIWELREREAQFVYYYYYSLRMGLLKWALKIQLKLLLTSHIVYLVHIPFNDKTNRKPQ